jgi:hypothetical protein
MDMPDSRLHWSPFWFGLALLPALLMIPLPAVPSQNNGTAGVSLAAVPSLGCRADGQSGPLPAPDVTGRLLRIDSIQARQLAYYKAEYGPGVLAPQGWNCFETYGSSGESLTVTPPDAGNAPNLANVQPGPMVQLTTRSGDTSGRFTVAQVMARIFPLEKDFVKQVIDEGIESASDFPSGPYPADRLVYRNDRIVEYETPAGATGLGTMMGVPTNNAPVRGVAMLHGPAPDLWLLQIRLPANTRDLATGIIEQVEREP